MIRFLVRNPQPIIILLEILSFAVRLDVESKLSDRLSLVFALCRQQEKIPALLALSRALCRENKKTIIFCATMKHVELVVAIFREAGMDPAFLYSQLDPAARKQNIFRLSKQIIE
jgi:ATP-dependent RNA helicase DDX54/DBP10